MVTKGDSLWNVKVVQHRKSVTILCLTYREEVKAIASQLMQKMPLTEANGLY